MGFLIILIPGVDKRLQTCKRKPMVGMYITITIVEDSNDYHGPSVLSLIAATTDNNTGMAATMWHVTAVPAIEFNSGVYKLVYGNGPGSPIPNIISMSYMTTGYNSTLVQALQDALDKGIILVAATGNSLNDPNQEFFGTPQARLSYDFYGYDSLGNLEQVIGVSATGYQREGTYGGKHYSASVSFDTLKEFRWDGELRNYSFDAHPAYPSDDIWNYSTSTDILNDPEHAFVDVAAPGMSILTVDAGWYSRPYSTNDRYFYPSGTSQAAPIVAGMIGLMLSVNPNLTPAQVYKIVTSTTDRDPVSLPPGTSIHTLADGRKYDKYNGFGRINAYKAVKYTLEHYGGTLTQDATLPQGSTWTLYKNVYIDGASTLTIPQGVHLKMASNVEIVVRPGSKIMANGTSADPVRFERADPNQQWNTIALQGNGNTFNWCLFEGASTNVSVESDNNQFNHCTFRNAWRGIGTYYNQSGDGQLSYFKLNYCMVEDNTSVGVVVYHSDAGFAHTTIQHNASAGLWLYDSPAHDFFETAIIDNATDNSGRDGVEVVGGSDVILFTYDGVNYGPGQNRIANNPGDQVLNDYSSTLNLGIPNTPDWGFNGIFGGSGYRVNNENSSTVSAGEDWWGTSSPSSSLFNGPVDYSYYLTFDPSGGAGVGSSNYPGKMAPSVSEPVLVQKKTSKVSSETSGVKMVTSSTTAATGTKKQEREIRREQIHDLWGKISQAPDAKSKMKDIRELYRLHLMSVYDTSFATERRQDRTIWDGLIQGYLSGSQTGPSSLSSSQAEHLMLTDLHEAYRSGRYVEARNKIDQYKPYITSAKGNIALMVNQMNLLDQQGSYQQELALLDKVEQAEVKLGEPAKQVAARYQIARENIQEALGQVAGSGSNGAAGNKADSVVSVKPARTTLNANYPNPFNPTTTIRYQLAKGSHVRLTVWNILGRRVVTLVNSNQQKGVHQVTFNASQLASGVYFYRLQAGDRVLVKKMLLMK